MTARAMLDRLDRAAIVFLLAVHAGLLGWAVIGFAEMVLAEPPWPRLSNPLFSPAMLFLQWFLVAGAALTLLLGYALRWPRLRGAMALWYAAMAATCAWQTFMILTHDTRFHAMALEYAEYVAILVYLHYSPIVRARLGSLAMAPIPVARSPRPS